MKFLRKIPYPVFLTILFIVSFTYALAAQRGAVPTPFRTTIDAVNCGQTAVTTCVSTIMSASGNTKIVTGRANLTAGTVTVSGLPSLTYTSCSVTAGPTSGPGSASVPVCILASATSITILNTTQSTGLMFFMLTGF